MREQKVRKIIIEKYGIYCFMMLFPSGRTREVRNRSDAERIAKKYLARGIKPNERRVDCIEWRDLCGTDTLETFDSAAAVRDREDNRHIRFDERDK
jgi:hypothetical protein